MISLTEQRRGYKDASSISAWRPLYNVSIQPIFLCLDIMPLLCLPSELLLLVLTHLEAERDINSLVRTNKQLYAVLNLYLYQRNGRNSSSALIWACRRGSEATARRAIEGGAQILTKTPVWMDCDRWLPLSIAAYNNHEAIIKLLLKTMLVEPNTEHAAWNPLFCASLFGLEMVLNRILEAEKADVDATDCKGQTPFPFATLYENTLLKHY